MSTLRVSEIRLSSSSGSFTDSTGANTYFTFGSTGNVTVPNNLIVSGTSTFSGNLVATNIVGSSANGNEITIPAGSSLNINGLLKKNGQEFTSGKLARITYAPSQQMGRIAYTGGSSATVFDTTSCPANYTVVNAGVSLLWLSSFVTSVDSTHMALFLQYNINNAGWVNAQTFTGVSGAFTSPWQSNANNTDTVSTYGTVPSGLSAGAVIQFRVGAYSPQNYEWYIGGSDANWSGLQYARGQHVIMEIFN